MYIHFDYQGSHHKAAVTLQEDNKILVLLEDENLSKEFGTSLHFFIKDNNIEFHNPNKCHSELFSLSSSILKAIQIHFNEMQ